MVLFHSIVIIILTNTITMDNYLVNFNYIISNVPFRWLYNLLVTARSRYEIS